MTEADTPIWPLQGEPSASWKRAPSARAELVRLHGRGVLAICLAHTSNLHDAEDLAQDVFLKAFRRLESLREPDRARAWLFQIARRVCTDHHKKKRSPDPLPEHLPAKTNIENPRIQQLHASLGELPESYRETITLYYLGGRSCPQIAAALGITESAARQRLARARIKLHELMTRNEP